MSRKDYIAAAEIISRISNPTTRQTVAQDFADMFKRNNSRFDYTRFLDACKICN